MSVRSQLGDPVPRAVRALVALRNVDGGIPATKAQDPSGCWTTASTLEAVVVSGQVEAAGMKSLLGMVHFLVSSQLGDRGEPGVDAAGWPLIGGGRTSTMATGHAVAALAAVRPMVDHEPTLQRAIHDAISAGVGWLTEAQQPDGGWGTEPESGHDGASSRVISTLLAVHGLAALGERHATSAVLRRASSWIEDGYVTGEGWAPFPGATCDPASTARALSTLARAGDPWLTAERAEILTEHLMVWRNEESLWSIAVEGVLQGDASGAIVFNQNTNADVLLALLEMPEPERHLPVVAELTGWLRSTQDAGSGLWRLQSPLQVDAAVTTWSTSEWIVAVSAGRELLASQEVAAAVASHRRFDTLHVFLTLVSLSLLAVAIGAPEWLADRWDDLSKGQRGAVLTISGGVLIALLTEMVLAPTRALMRRARETRVMGSPNKNRAQATKGKQNG